MARSRVVDDIPEAAAFIEKLLVEEGYAVNVVHTADRARAELASKRYDVAIIDLKLRSPKGDHSGLDVAAGSDQLIPKIIVSSEADRDNVMDAVRVGHEGYAIATEFLARDGISIDRPDLINAVRAAIQIRRLWITQNRDSISEQLAAQYVEVQRQATLHNRIHIVVNVAFAAFMIWAALNVHRGVVEMLFTMIAVVAGEVTNLLLARGKGEALNVRAERQHAELLQAKRFEQLLSACDSIASAKEAERLRIRLISAATDGWINHPSAPESSGTLVESA